MGGIYIIVMRMASEEAKPPSKEYNAPRLILD